MSDDREYMNGENSPADFTRRRVAGILRRERPLYENGDETRWEGIKALGKIHSSSQDSFGVIRVGTLRVYTYNLFGKLRTYRVIPSDTIPYPTTQLLKKLANSNLRSRFFKPPCGR